MERRPGVSAFGISVASGPSYAMLVDALREMGLLGEFPILKLAISYPVDLELVDELATMCERIVVVEERRSFLEKQVAGIFSARSGRAGRIIRRAQVELWGKGNFPRAAGARPSLVAAGEVNSFDARIASVDFDRAVGAVSSRYAGDST